MLRRPLLLTAMAVAVLTVGSPAEAITGGAVDGSAHPYVVGIVPPGASTLHCSGVLVRPDRVGPPVILTDAHCLYRFGRTGTARVSFAAVFTSSTPLFTAHYRIDPAYQPGSSLTHDLAVLVLSARAPVAPASLAAVGRLSAALPRQVVTVGTGSPYRGQRRMATEIVTGLTSSWLYLREGSGNSCGGDSGGPDLLPGTASVVALTDQGSCSDSQDTRVDTTEAHDLVDLAASPLPALTAQLSSGSTRAGSSVVLRGTADRAFAGRRVYRQGYYGGAWHIWASTLLSSSGGYTFVITPTVRTTDVYRTYLPATSRSPGGVSRSVRLVVS